MTAVVGCVDGMVAVELTVGTVVELDTSGVSTGENNAAADDKSDDFPTSVVTSGFKSASSI